MSEKEKASNPVPSSHSSQYAGITYNAAITKTVYLNPQSPPLSKAKKCCLKFCCGCTFQVILVLMFLVCVNEIDPLIFGLSFLEKVPPEFECLEDT